LVDGKSVRVTDLNFNDPLFKKKVYDNIQIINARVDFCPLPKKKSPAEGPNLMTFFVEKALQRKL